MLRHVKFGKHVIKLCLLVKDSLELLAVNLLETIISLRQLTDTAIMDPVFPY